MNNNTELNNGLCEQDSSQMEKEMIEKLYLQGCSIAKIAQELRLKKDIVEKRIEELSKDVHGQRDLDKEKAMHLWKLDRLLECWYPVATEEKITLSNKNKSGEQVLKKDVYASGLKAAVIVLRILDRRARLLGFGGSNTQTSPFNAVTSEIPIEELEKQLTDEDREALKGCFYE